MGCMARKKKPTSIQLPIIRFYKDKTGKFVNVYATAYMCAPALTVKPSKRKRPT